MVIIIMLILAAPVFLVGLGSRNITALNITAVIMAILGIFTGNPIYIAADLFAVGITYVIARSIILEKTKESTKTTMTTGNRDADTAPKIEVTSLPFKSTTAAFQYACKFLDTTIRDERVMIGIVLSIGPESDYFVSIANPYCDATPTDTPGNVLRTLWRLTQATPDMARYLAPKIGKAYYVPNLEVLDLVYIRYHIAHDLAAMGLPFATGAIIAKASPVFDLKKSMFSVIEPNQ